MVFPGGLDSIESACTPEDPIQSLHQEDPLEKEMATHYSVIARQIPLTEMTDAWQGIKSWT